jgi:peptidyl-prolyl cis-trans isomerase SurA
MPKRSPTLLSLLVLLLLVLSALACEKAPLPEARPAEPAPEATPPPNAPSPEAPARSEEEACAQVIVVSYTGASFAPESVTRSELDARARAEELWRSVEAGNDFTAIARADSDAAASGPRGGLIGTYARSEWPAAHDAIRDAVFRLQVGQTSEVLAAPYGYVIARRCAVEKIHTQHILVRFQGARNAGADVTRTEEEAARIANEIHTLVSGGAPFDSVARERSEDSSAENGGDLGWVGRGRLAPEYEEAAWSLAPGRISRPVRTEFGFHVIKRVE